MLHRCNNPARIPAFALLDGDYNLGSSGKFLTTPQQAGLQPRAWQFSHIPIFTGLASFYHPWLQAVGSTCDPLTHPHVNIPTSMFCVCIAPTSVAWSWAVAVSTAYGTVRIKNTFCFCDFPNVGFGGSFGKQQAGTSVHMLCNHWHWESSLDFIHIHRINTRAFKARGPDWFPFLHKKISDAELEVLMNWNLEFH